MASVSPREAGQAVSVRLAKALQQLAADPAGPAEKVSRYSGLTDSGLALERAHGGAVHTATHAIFQNLVNPQLGREDTAALVTSDAWLELGLRYVAQLARAQIAVDAGTPEDRVDRDVLERVFEVGRELSLAEPRYRTDLTRRFADSPIVLLQRARDAAEELLDSSEFRTSLRTLVQEMVSQQPAAEETHRARMAELLQMEPTLNFVHAVMRYLIFDEIVIGGGLTRRPDGQG